MHNFYDHSGDPAERHRHTRGGGNGVAIAVMAGCAWTLAGILAWVIYEIVRAL